MTGVLAPLGALFRHAKGPNPDASEILILSFNHDLAFFEKAVLGVAQLTGARITIVADAAMAHHDVYAVRRAGTAYLPGLAYCSGSFHPKLVVVASEGQAMVGIGSGNLSMAGWQGNDELWSWHNAGDGAGSCVVSSVGSWLRLLAASVSQDRSEWSMRGHERGGTEKVLLRPPRLGRPGPGAACARLAQRRGSPWVGSAALRWR